MSMKSKKGIVIHSVIGVLIMLLFRFLPVNLTYITPVGMGVLGVFIGTVYLWAAVDLIWPSLVSVFLLVVFGYFSMPEMLASLLGNPVILLMMFIMIMSNALSKYEVTPHLARWCLSLKIVRGRPYLFAFVMGIVIYVIAAFVGPIAPIFLFWPILSEVYRDVGYTKKDKFPKILTIYVVICSLLGFPIAPYMGNALVLIENFKGLIISSGANVVFELNHAHYIAAGVILGLAMMLAMLLLVKLLLRPDVEPFRNFDFKKFDENPLPPLTLSQKILSVGFVAMLLAMLIPSIIPHVPGMGYLAGLTNGIPLFTAAVLMAIRVNKKPVVNIPEILCDNFAWGSIFMSASAMVLGSALTSEKTGITVLLSDTFAPILTGMSMILFLVIFLIIMCILTNLLNSLVVGMIFAPIVLTYCSLSGVNPAPIVTLMIMVCLGTACVTPAASVFSAILHSNKEWTETRDNYIYSVFFVTVQMVIYLVLGIPLAITLS